MLDEICNRIQLLLLRIVVLLKCAQTLIEPPKQVDRHRDLEGKVLPRGDGIKVATNPRILRLVAIEVRECSTTGFVVRRERIVSSSNIRKDNSSDP